MTLSKARDLRCNQTDAEQKLWSLLRDNQLAGCKFRRQVPRGAYVVDFACLRRKLIVELDGGQHADAVQIAKDRRRTAWLESEGYRVLRFWNSDVLTGMDGVLSTIARALEQRRPPHPAPARFAHAHQACATLSPVGRGKEKQGEGEAISRHDARSEAEQKLWARLRGRGLQGYKFRRQVPLGPFIVDFCCYDERLVIELDGGQRRDPARTLWLESRGFRVLRFWNSEVLENMDGVLTRILETLEQP